MMNPIVQQRMLKAITEAETPVHALYKLFNEGFYVNIFAEQGLSNEYTEDDIDLIEAYFRRREVNAPYQSVEFMTRVPYAFYIGKIFETNNPNVELKVVVPSGKRDTMDYAFEIILHGKKGDSMLFPIVRLGRLFKNKESEEDYLSEWYKMAVMTTGFAL